MFGLVHDSNTLKTVLQLSVTPEKCVFIAFPTEETTCSADVTKLGPNQTVLGFTFYGGEGSNNTYDTYHRDYFAGIEVELNQ